MARIMKSSYARSKYVAAKRLISVSPSHFGLSYATSLVRWSTPSSCETGSPMRRIAGLSVVAGAFLSYTTLYAQIRAPAPQDHSIVNPPIIVGVSNVQSGPSKSLGQNLLRGSIAYFELSNELGGIYGRKISILLKDDKYEPDPAVQNTNELIEKEKSFFLFDYVGTPTLTRVLPLL